MTNRAIFHNRRMFVGKGSLFIRVALKTKIRFGFVCFKTSFASVRVMATQTVHPILADRMTRGICEFDHNIAMAIVADFIADVIQTLIAPHLMNLVTVRAGNSAYAVSGMRPIGKIGGQVTRQTYSRYFLGRQRLKRFDILRLARINMF